MNVEEMRKMPVGSVRTCDAPMCGSPGCPYTMKAGVFPHPKNPKKDILALVVSVTNTPPMINGLPNPDHDPSQTTPVAWLEGSFDLCNRDCFENVMDVMWKNIERRRDRLWGRSRSSSSGSAPSDA